MAKLTAAEVLYMADGNVKRCDRCVFWFSHQDRCALIDPETTVKASQVCGLYVNGEPMTAENAVRYSSLDPETVDLGPGNTSCGNCRFGGGETCGNPDLDGFPIDNKGGCCNAWEASKRESNPNHDPHSGEFTSGGGGGVATEEPKTADEWIAKGEQNIKAAKTEKKSAKAKGTLDDEARAAIANTPGAKANEDGSITLDVSRYQDPEQSGSPSLRTGVFFLPELKSPWGKHYKGKTEYGGSERVEGRTTVMKPFVVKASTGGNAVVKAYDAVKGKGAYEAMRSDVLKSIFAQGGPKAVEFYVEGVLKKYGGDPDLAGDIIEHSQKGNLLPYAIQEHIAAHALRDAGYDSVLGYSKHEGKPRLAELFDLRKKDYPESGVRVESNPNHDPKTGEFASAGGVPSSSVIGIVTPDGKEDERPEKGSAHQIIAQVHGYSLDDLLKQGGVRYWQQDGGLGIQIGDPTPKAAKNALDVLKTHRVPAGDRIFLDIPGGRGGQFDRPWQAAGAIRKAAGLPMEAWAREAATFDPAKHPRNKDGEFTDSEGQVVTAKSQKELADKVVKELPEAKELSTESSFVMPDGRLVARTRSILSHGDIAMHFLPEDVGAKLWPHDAPYSGEQENKVVREFMLRTGAARVVYSGDVNVAVAQPLTTAQGRVYMKAARQAQMPLIVDVYDKDGGAESKEFKRPTLDEVNGWIEERISGKKRESVREAFEPEAHPRDKDGRFTDKGKAKADVQQAASELGMTPGNATPNSYYKTVKYPSGSERQLTLGVYTGEGKNYFSVRHLTSFKTPLGGNSIGGKREFDSLRDAVRFVRHAEQHEDLRTFESMREAEFDPEDPLSAAERAARVASGDVTQEDIESSAIDAAQAAADKVRDWVNTRLDKGARAVATLYKKNRDGLVGKIKQIYDNFLGDDPTLVQARQIGALDTLNRVINEHTNRLADEVGNTSLDLIAGMVEQHPKIVNRFYSPVLGADLDIPTPKPYQTVLGELTTRVVGGGTFFDRLMHVNQGMKDQIFHATRQSLIAGSGFEPLKNNIHRIFGVDDLPEPKSNAYGSINTYENEARRQWNALMDETGKRSGQKSVWFSMIPDPDTTPGCAARHGMLIEDLDAPPPRHGNCRCEVLVVDADWDLDAMQTEAAEYLKTQGYTIDSALAEESQARKRFKHVLREAIWIEECLEADFDPSKHPHDPHSGEFVTTTGGATPTPAPKQAKQMRLDLGDSGGWVPKNPADRERQDYLEERKTQAVKDLSHTFEEIKGQEITVPGPSGWEGLDDDAKSEIQNQWENDHYDEFYQDALKEWRRSGDADSQANEEVAEHYYDNPDPLNEAVKTAIADVTNEPKAEEALKDKKPHEITEIYQAGESEDGDRLKELLGDHLDDDQRSDLMSKIKEHYDTEFEERKESVLEDIEPSEKEKERISENLYESLSDAFYQLPGDVLDDMARDGGPGDDHVTIEEPKKWVLEDPGEKQDRDPSSNYNQDRRDYEMTKGIAHALLIRRAEDLWKEEYPDKDMPSFLDVSEHFWEDWKRDSFSPGTLGMHSALVNELGANTLGREKEKANKPKAIADKLLAGVPPEEINKELEQGVKHKPEEAVYAKALWDTTQFLMTKAKMPDIDVYRAIYIDGKDLAEDKYKQENVLQDLPAGEQYGKVSTFVSPSGERKDLIGVKLPDLPLKQNPAQSFTLDRTVANNWGGVGGLPANPTRVVIRAKVPTTAVWSLPVYGKNVQGENEVVVLGTPWKKWDAWKNHAPSTKQAALEAQRKAMKQDGSIHTGSGLVIDLSDPRQTGGKHWLYHNPDGSRKVTRAKTKTREADFDPAKHPRDPKGEFTNKGGGAWPINKVYGGLASGQEERDRVVSEFEDDTKEPKTKWTEGAGGETSDPDNANFKDKEAGYWGGSHSGSTAITGASAKIMGIEGYDDDDPDGKMYSSPRLAKKMLQGVYDSKGSREALFHGFENTAKIDWKVGDTLTLPLLASTGSIDDCAGYGVRSFAEDQRGEATIFAFPKGTPMQGYQKWNKADAKDFGHVWSEAIVAGKFKVVGIGEYENFGWQMRNIGPRKQDGAHVISKVVKLEPLEKFNPETKEWTKV